MWESGKAEKTERERGRGRELRAAETKGEMKQRERRTRGKIGIGKPFLAFLSWIAGGGSSAFRSNYSAANDRVSFRVPISVVISANHGSS